MGALEIKREPKDIPSAGDSSSQLLFGFRFRVLRIPVAVEVSPVGIGVEPRDSYQ